MKRFAIIILALCFNQPSPKVYRFTGKFQSASILEGSGNYTFIGLNGTPKEFAHDMSWNQKLPYIFFDDLANTNSDHAGKWFVITYSGEFGRLSGADKEDEYWYRRIQSIKMITIPKSKDQLITKVCKLQRFQKQYFIMEFVELNGEVLTITFDSDSLKELHTDFIKQADNGHYDQNIFEIQYRVEYEVGSCLPVLNKLYSITMK